MGGMVGGTTGGGTSIGIIFCVVVEVVAKVILFLIELNNFNNCSLLAFRVLSLFSLLIFLSFKYCNLSAVVLAVPLTFFIEATKENTIPRINSMPI